MHRFLKQLLLVVALTIQPILGSLIETPDLLRSRLKVPVSGKTRKQIRAGRRKVGLKFR